MAISQLLVNKAKPWQNARVNSLVVDNGVSAADILLPGVTLSSQTVVLTAAQILAMNTTPVQLIPAPGAGMVNIPVSVLFCAHYGSAAFGGGGNMVVQWGNAAGATGQTTGFALPPTVMTGLGSGTAVGYMTPGDGATYAQGLLASAGNAAIYISYPASPAFTGGTGCTLTLTILYATISAS
jgi:hypothetical protein